MAPLRFVSSSATGGQVGVDAGRQLRRGEAGGRDKGRAEVLVVDVAQQGRRSVEPAVAAAESAVGEDAAPILADEGGTDEERRLVRRDAEEDLFHELLRQRRQSRRHVARSVGLHGYWDKICTAGSDRALLGVK